MSSLIGTREKQLLKDLKRLVKDSNVAVASGSISSSIEEHRCQIEDRAHGIISEFQSSVPTSSSGVLAIIGLQLVQKERSISLILLHHIIVRGLFPTSEPPSHKSQQLKNELVFSLCGLYLTVLLGEDRRWDAASRALNHAWNAVKTNCTLMQAGRRDDDRIARVFDVYLLLNARAAFISNELEEAMRHLSQMTAHKLVLDEETYALVAILKCLVQLCQGHLSDAYTTMKRRETQHKALNEIHSVTSILPDTGFKSPSSENLSTHTSHPKQIPNQSQQKGSLNVHGSVHSPMAQTRPSPRIIPGSKIHPTSMSSPLPANGHKSRTGDVIGSPLDDIDESKVYFNEFKIDYHRGNKYEVFIKHLSGHDIVARIRSFLGEWTMDLKHLVQFATDLNVLE